MQLEETVVNKAKTKYYQKKKKINTILKASNKLNILTKLILGEVYLYCEVNISKADKTWNILNKLPMSRKNVLKI